MPRKLVDREQVGILTRQGKTAPQIAAELACSIKAVQNARAALGLTRNRMPTPDALARVAAMVEDGCAFTEIERTVGVSRKTVGRRHPGKGWTPEQGGQHSSMLRYLRRGL